ncbi:MAG: DNA-directed DNA polymerase II small subunit [Methanobacteriota archaeon]|nr:MAG: DNA-directed DNA polymerase II small subunit [Euryarchaeota archaeon]
MKRSVLNRFGEMGILLDPKAVDALMRLSDPESCANRIINDVQNRPLVLTEEDVIKYASDERDGNNSEATDKHRENAPAIAPPVDAKPREFSRDVKVLKDVTGNSTCVGNVIDFAKLFKDRFSTLKKMLAKRRELAGLMPISRAKKLERDLRFAGIVNDSRFTKNGHTIIEVEDDTDKIQVLVPKGTARPNEAFLKDEVIGVVGATSRDGGIVIAKDVIRPDVPLSSGMAPNGSQAIVAFISDIHVGSNTFLEVEWRRMIDWLKKDPVARDIGYIVMPGDLVDGIGVYPGQEDELKIDDLYEQYAALSEITKDLPDWIKVVMMPGNHDAVRLAEPQPALPKDIRSLFDSSVKFVGNPCYLEIEGRTILAYHGKSIDDFNSGTRHLNYTNPQETMREMLRRRHLAPVYGDKTPLAPEQKDYLVIDSVPDIFVTGHVHVCKVDEYRGIRLINASAWQSQTAFQRMHNQMPDPAKVPMVHLGTGECWVEDFSAQPHPRRSVSM